MSHYVILAPAYTGHLNPLGALGRAIAARGHRVTVLSTPNAADRIRAAGLEFAPIAAAEFPPGEWERQMERAGAESGLCATAAAGRMVAGLTRGILRDLPDALGRLRLEGLVMDQICIGAESVCAVHGLPLAVACSALTLHIESRVPPPYFPWHYRSGWPFRVRNTLGTLAANMTGLGVARLLSPYRWRHGLPMMRCDFVNELLPSLVQVAQQPPFFDFPRRHLPDHVHCTGPWLDDHAHGQPPPFPWERLDGRPLVYISMGTIQSQLQTAFAVIRAACRHRDVQLVFALGRRGAVVETAPGGNELFVDYAPQRALLARAALTLCHGGLNTTLEALVAGVPVVAISISNDQPGNAARLEHLGLGAWVPFTRLTPERLRLAIDRAWSPEVRERVRRTAAELAPKRGAAVAAELIERAFTTRQRVRRPRGQGANC